MSRLGIRLSKRDFGGPLAYPDVGLAPVRYSWNALWGPETAEIEASGNAWALWQLCNGLRAPVEIVDELGQAVWWGYTSETTIGTGAVELGLSLEAMANRVAVQFQDQGSGSDAAALTDWLEDADSVAEYGVLELLASLDSGSLEAAAGLRARMLRELRYPVPTMRHVGSGGSLKATILCRGWGSTLGWQYYANEVLTTATTTAQMAAILAEKAQFITGSDLLATGDISLSQFQDGTKTAREILENLLAAGMNDGSGLLATITRERVARIYPEPTTDSLLLLADGRVTDLWGNRYLGHTCPVGQWCLLRDVIPPTVDVSRMANPTRFFVQRAEYTVATGTLILEPRGALSPWQALSGGAGGQGGGGGEAWVGRREGPHAGLFALENQDDGTWSVFGEGVDTANVPFISFGARNYKPNSKWARFGYADALNIRLGASSGGSTDPEDHPDVEVPAAAVALEDAGGHFAVDDVESALQELGPLLTAQSGAGETVGFTAGVGSAVLDDSTFTGNVGSTAYRISDVVKALKNLGLLAP